MKKLSIFILPLVCISLLSCRHFGHDVSISYSEKGHYYSMSAWFNKNKSRAVDEFMNERIGDQSNTSFVNMKMDGQLTLDDHTRFYLNKYPGHIEIKLDKHENSSEAYHRIRSMCEGLKKVIAN